MKDQRFKIRDASSYDSVTDQFGRFTDRFTASMSEIELACPHCMAHLDLTNEICHCRGCDRNFPVLLGIPDLRISMDAWVDYQADRDVANSLAAIFDAESSQGLIEKYWRARGETNRGVLESRVQCISRTESKYREQLSTADWMGSPSTESGPRRCLELGCGPGGFLLAAAEHFDLAVGVDICLAWLVIARKRLEEQGRMGLLLCACGERLPFTNDQFDLVGLFDVIEHVTDRGRMLQELFRVTRLGGKVICTTPNRFSLAAEPHVGVWGVGFMPRAWMRSYVRWRAGKEYHHTHPLSIFELRALFKRHPAVVCDLRIPTIWEGDLRGFGPVKRAFARAYNAVLRVGFVRLLLLLVAPFFLIVGQKNRSGSRTNPTELLQGE